ncbi:hypothetical protein RND61_14495 [Streptomyces sp. TRM76323]|uniref:Integral membrane protein n=1 Tax=Streptomyces tamarix TaxID=3078565 RepID=A0ABU3QKJ2_9ACTN|nr:hypothetical protein [Streptomyces tamarix]MDT9683271.1 hypothetical protein [Streptomyces tamarix]
MPDRGRQSTDDSNPFAPPPEGSPDQPWQPRRPADGGDGSGTSGEGGGGEGGRDGREGRWGSRWSPRQPGRSSDDFGGEPSRQGRPQQDGPQLRWDPTDPSQRRARYALLSGMWGFFFAVFDFPELALLLGALALYWGISSLRERNRGETAATAVKSQAVKSQTTAAVSGLITGALALVIVATMFTFQLVYRDFYTCVDDALTKDGQLSCNERLPDPLRDLVGVKQ